MKKILIFNRNDELTFTYLSKNQDLKNFEYILICEKNIENRKFADFLSQNKKHFSVHQYDYSFQGFFNAMKVLKSVVVLEKIIFMQPKVALESASNLESLKMADFESSLCTNVLKPTLAIGYLLPLITRGTQPEIQIILHSFRGCSFNYIYACTKQALRMYLSSLQIEYPLLQLKLEESHRLKLAGLKT